MQHEVIVVGGGIGGLTTAALLSARGVDVCVFERQSHVGGCLANFEHLGYSFEPTAGLYSGWESGGTWEKVFANLPVAPPSTSKLSPNYIVRLPDGQDVAITNDSQAFEDRIAKAFPDCAPAAIRFFQTLRELQRGDVDRDAAPAETLLRDTSRTFRLFIDAQLQMFAQCTADYLSAARAAAVFATATGGLWSIGGGGQALADCLADSLKRSGGAVRLDSPVLRLAYGSDGVPIGIDLLNGERVVVTRAIVSNLTIWDTYGKLVGLSHTPRPISAQLGRMSAWGAYQIFISVEAPAARQLPSQLLLVYESDSTKEYEPTNQQLMLNLASEESGRAPAGKCALTVSAFTNVEDWFAFHEDNTSHEQRDQAELEKWWTRLHSAMPELGDSVEVIETASPQTFYEMTRRKLGMIGAVSPPPPTSGNSLAVTPFPNVFMVSDTIADGLGIESVARLGASVADTITDRA